MTQEEYREIERKLREAQTDDTPFAVVQDDKIAVVGDANKTEIKKHDYQVSVVVPVEKISVLSAESIEKQVGNYVIGKKEYKDVFIRPRNSLKIMAAAAELMPFFNNLEEDGSVSAMSDEDLVATHKLLSDEVVDAMYRLVKNVLNISDDEVDMIAPPSVIRLVGQFIDDYPELFGEADAFFE